MYGDDYKAEAYTMHFKDVITYILSDRLKIIFVSICN